MSWELHTRVIAKYHKGFLHKSTKSGFSQPYGKCWNLPASALGWTGVLQACRSNQPLMLWSRSFQFRLQKKADGVREYHVKWFEQNFIHFNLGAAT